MQANPTHYLQRTRHIRPPSVLLIGALFMVSAGCASWIRPWDLRVTSKTQRCTFKWTLAGHTATLDITVPTRPPPAEAPSHSRPGRPSVANARHRPQPGAPQGSDTGTRTSKGNQPARKQISPTTTPGNRATTAKTRPPLQTFHLTYKVTERQATMLKELVRLDEIRALARRYKNVCQPKAPTAHFSIDTPSYHKNVTTQGFTPQAVRNLWGQILARMPTTVPKPPVVASIPTCPTQALRATAATNGTAGQDDDQCVSDEVGLVHDPVDELWRGKLPAIRAIAPKRWKLILRYRPPLSTEYFSVPMRPRRCVYTAILPARAVGYWTLQYYILATDAEGKKADGSASADSPHIVTIRSCLETTQ